MGLVSSSLGAVQTPHVLALEFDVHFANHRLIVDLDQPDAVEVDEEQVHGGRVVITEAFQSVGVENQQTCRPPPLANYRLPTTSTPTPRSNSKSRFRPEIANLIGIATWVPLELDLHQLVISRHPYGLVSC